MIFPKAESKGNKHFILKFLLCYILVNFLYLNCSFSNSDKQRFNPAVEISLQQSDLQTCSQADDIQNSVWRIQYDSSSSETAFIGPNLFFTDFYVLQSMLKNENSFKPLLFKQKDLSFYPTVKRVIAVSALHNLAILETTDSVSSYLDINDEKSFDCENKGGSRGSPVLDEKGQAIAVVPPGYQINQNTVKLLGMKKLLNLNNLISGNTALNCSDFINLATCIKQELENLEKLIKQYFNIDDRNFLERIFDTDLSIAFDIVKPSAEQGYPVPQYGLAMMYYKGGVRVKKDIQLAFDWMKQSADQGLAPAQYQLAKMYYLGEGTKQNRKLAFVLVKQSADQDYLPAQKIFRLIGGRQQAFTAQNRFPF